MSNLIHRAPRILHRKDAANPDDPAPAPELKSLSEQFAAKLGEVKGFHEEITGKMAKTDEVTETLKHDTDKALTELNELGAKMKEMEQALEKRRGDRDPSKKTIGQQFVDEGKEGIEDFASKGRSARAYSMDFKATITSATTDTDGAAGAGVAPTRLPGIQGIPDRRLTIRDLLTPGQMDGNSLEYVRETGFTNNAGMVAEGDKKPGSDIKFDVVSTGPKVIAHWMKATRQILSDFSQLRSYIDYRLRYGVMFKEEEQLLYGDGTGQNLTGIMQVAQQYNPAFTVDSETPMDRLRLAMLQAALAEFPATGHVLNPIDWTRIELTKDDLGRYIIGNPQGTTAPTMWGLPVVATQAMSAGQFLTGAFRLGAQLFDRWNYRVELGYENDDFTKNLVTILGEERVALAIYREEAFVTGNLVPATQTS